MHVPQRDVETDLTDSALCNYDHEQHKGSERRKCTDLQGSEA